MSNQVFCTSQKSGESITGFRVFGAALLTLALTSPSFSAPPPPAFTPNHVFIGGKDVTTTDGTIFEFDAAGNFVRKIAVPSGTGGDYIYGVTFGPDGNLYCAAQLAEKIIRIEPSLDQTDFVTADKGLSSPVGVTFGPQGRLYVANRAGSASVIAFDNDGSVVASNSPAGGLFPSYVTFGPEGHLFVSMFGSSAPDQIQEWDADLRYIRTIGSGAFADFPANVVATT